MSELTKADDVLTKRILELSNQLSHKLSSLGVLPPDTNGNIAHHLAEVCVSGRNVETGIVPQLLNASSTDAEKLAKLSHDLMTELEEIRDGIDAMFSDVTSLMNVFNK